MAVMQLSEIRARIEEISLRELDENAAIAKATRALEHLRLERDILLAEGVRLAKEQGEQDFVTQSPGR